MGFTVLYWHWIAVGLVLILAELFVPSFTIVWFGLAAIAVGGLTALVPSLPTTWQLLAWALSSCALVVVWFRYLKPRMGDRTKAGNARAAVLGECGRVVKAPVDGERGVMRFTVPLLGSDEWLFICAARVEIGDAVSVRDISGNTLIVEPRDPSLAKPGG